MQELNCNQVITLLTFYIENKLSPKLSANLEYHLSICPRCREKYMKLRKILQNFSEIKARVNSDSRDFPEEEYNTPQYKVFKENLSAYVDNELSNDDNIRIKKIAIANPLARKDLENVYSFKQLLQSSFNRTKNNMKNDYTSKILNKLSIPNEQLTDDSFEKLITIFTCIMIFILAGILNLLNF